MSFSLTTLTAYGSPFRTRPVNAAGSPRRSVVSPGGMSPLPRPVLNLLADPFNQIGSPVTAYGPRDTAALAEIEAEFAGPGNRDLPYKVEQITRLVTTSTSVIFGGEIGSQALDQLSRDFLLGGASAVPAITHGPSALYNVHHSLLEAKPPTLLPPTLPPVKREETFELFRDLPPKLHFDIAAPIYESVLPTSANDGDKNSYSPVMLPSPSKIHRQRQTLMAAVPTKNKRVKKLSTQKKTKGIGGPFKCPNCDTTFTRKKNKRRHMLKYDTTFVRFQCTWPDCCRTFVRPDDFDGHMRRHNDERNHACTFKDCTKTFIRRSDMLVHRRRHTESVKVETP